MKKRSKILQSKAHFLKYIPNTLTLCNSLCGFAAILYMIQSYKATPSTAINIFYVASWVIFFAMIFDVFDGLAARLLNAASLHGIQMDSLADMVTFGVAPATIVVIMTDTLKAGVMENWQVVLVYLLCSVYIGCAALRLATYNVHAMASEKKGDPSFFSGMPSPGAAAAICAVVFFAHETKLPVEKFAFVLPVYAAILGLLMVSKVPYVHAGRWLFSVRKSKRKMLMLAIFILISAVFRTAGIVFLITTYVLSGPLMQFFRMIRRKEV